MRLAYILPRYGPEVLGGAETLARGVIERMAQRGHDIEVWTTCARNIDIWTNEYPVGVEQINGVTVRRFLVQPNCPYDLFAGLLTLENQYRWVNNLAHSPSLYQYITDNGAMFDLLIFMPYIVGMTFCGARIHPHKSVIWPCLHDEIFAYLAPTRQLLVNTVGIIFNTSSEQELMTNKLRIEHPRTVVAGMGFDITAGDGVAFRQQHPHLVEEFFVYAGRIDAGKNVDRLIQYVLRYQSRHQRKLNLLLLGNGPLSNELNYSGIIPLGFVDEATKRNALAAAAFLCQPSLYESFSIVLMEAWAQGKPVLVHEHCAVTVDHVRRAQGGLYFADYDDFEGAVDYLLANPKQAERMGTNGQAYVEQNYNWTAIIDRLEGALLSWLR